MADWFPALLVFILGLSFGSCITLISWRWPRGERIGMARSACPACRTVLPPRSLVPVLSWIFQRGRCHACAVPIHWRYPAIELVSGTAFLAIYYMHGDGANAILLMALSFALLVMIVIDFEHLLLPDSMQWLAGGLALPYHWFYGMHIADQCLGFLVGAVVGWGLQAGYKRFRGRDGLGSGDVKFLAMAGLWLGPVGLVPLFLLSGLLGIATSLLWRAWKGEALFPFGPALAISLWLLVVFPSIVQAFWNVPQRWAIAHI